MNDKFVTMNPTLSDTIFITRSPEELYDMVSDVTRMGEWSPIVETCWWEDGEGPREGAWFGGRNVTPERTWETRSLVEVARRGEEFAFVVGGSWTRWSYRFDAVEGGTEVTETWEFLPGGVERFAERFGEDAENQLAQRREAARVGIPATLAAIKAAAESL